MALCALLSLALLSSAAACSTALDCYLNGACIAGACACDSAWGGATCATLVTGPATQLWPQPDPLPSNLSALGSSWGATIVQGDDGLFHGYFEVVCREFTWMHIAGSVVVHATAPRAAGPYAYSDIALPQQSMTPHIVRDTDGAWLLLHQRNASVVGDPLCTGAAAAAAFAAAGGGGGGGGAPLRATPPNASEFDGPPSIARATSLYGPWTPHDIVITPPPGRVIDNPNPSLLPLGAGLGYLLAFTSRAAPPAPYSEGVSFAHAADWRSGAFAPVAGTGGAPPPPELLDCEDPHLFRSARGYHALCHRRAPAPAPNPWNYSQAGGLGASANGLDWVWSPAPAYTTTVAWADGGAAGAPLVFARRERPEVVLDSAGRPAWLSNGVEVVTGTLGRPSLSIIAPLGPPPPPPQPRRRLYAVAVTRRSPAPVLSRGLPPGRGHSPCNFTYNPAVFPARPPALNASIAIVRVAGCPPSYGGAGDHLAYAECAADGSACSDLQPGAGFPFEAQAADPRAYVNPEDGLFYLSYSAAAGAANQSAVFWRRSATPAALGSWELLAADLPWRRNGAAFYANGRHHVLFGETFAPAYPGRYLPGIGLATTADFRAFATLNATLMVPAPAGPDPEVCLAAAAPPVQLSTGDWLHVFAAGTQGWGPTGPGVQSGVYAAGFLVLSGADPSVVLQRDVLHFFRPDADYEAGSNPAFPARRKHTVFVTSLVPVPGQADVFTAWYGAADANVATATVQVTVLD